MQSMDTLHLSFVKWLLLTFAIVLQACGSVGDVRDELGVEAYWRACLPSFAEPPADGFYRVRSFGRNEGINRVILDLIQQGEKTATFTSPWIYEGDRNATPVVGGYSVVTDLAGEPNFVIRTIGVDTKPFNAVTEADSQYEGPAVRPIEAWREVHWRFFTDMLAPLGRSPSHDMPVTVERFEVICAATESG